MFCGKSEIWTDIDLGEVPIHAVQQHDLLGGEESANGQTFAIDEEAIGETLSTALFTGRGERSLGWAHQSYLEVLAATFLKLRDFAAPEIVTLLSQPGADGKVWAPYREAAAWLAGTDPEVFRALLGRDPSVLLRSDTALVDDATRKQLVDNLLDLVERREAVDLDVFPFSDWGAQRLTHPHIEDQLRAWIEDPTKHFMSRRGAIRLAEQCHVTGLQKPLADLALNADEQKYLRVAAMHALVALAGPATQERLKPLAFVDSKQDPERELKGYALRVLWPGALTVEELFEALVEPGRRAIVGAYYTFCTKLSQQGLEAEQLPVALAWAKKQTREGRLWFDDVVIRVERQAWEHLHDPSVFDAYVELVHARLLQYRPVFLGEADRGIAASTMTDLRRRITTRLLERYPARPYEAGALLGHGLVTPADLPWILDHLERSADPEARERWANIVIPLWWGALEAELTEAVLRTAEKVSELDIKIQRSVEKDSKEADSLRENLRWQQRAQRRDPPVTIEPSPVDRVRKCLVDFEMGDLDAWWRLHFEMTLDVGGASVDGDYASNLTTLPGWIHADEATRDRIVEAAKVYLASRDATPDKWLGTSTIFRPATAGYRALRLLDVVDKDALKRLPGALWRAWTPIVIGFPIRSAEQGELEAHRLLLREAYLRAPVAFLDALTALMVHQQDQVGHFFIRYDLTHCWDERLGAHLLKNLSSFTDKPAFFGELLEELFTRKVGGVVAAARQFLDGVSLGASHVDLAREAGCALVVHDAVPAFRQLQNDTRFDSGFCIEVLLKAASSFSQWGPHARGLDRWADGFAASELAEVYLWWFELFPPSQDPPEMRSGDSHAVSDREMMADARDGLLAHLAGRATADSVSALEHLRKAQPGSDAILYSLIDARRSFLQHPSYLDLSHVLSLFPEKAKEAALSVVIRTDSANRPMRANDITNDKLSAAALGAPTPSPATAPTATKAAPHDPVDILLLTVIPEEYAAVHAILENATAVDGTDDEPNLYGYRRGIISRASGGHYRVVLALVGAAGNVNAGLATVTSVRRWKPRYAVVAGIAGGLAREQCTVGDVVVSTEIYGYEYGSLDAGFKPRPNWTYPVDRGLSNSAQVHAAVHEDLWSGTRWPAGKAPETLPKVLFGPVASGNKLVDNPTEPSFKVVLDHWPKLQAIEMEGAGAAAAIEELHAQGQRIGWLMVRGISDMPKAPAERPTEGAQSAERNAHKKLASATCARFLETWIQHAWPVAPGGAHPDPR